MDAVDQPQATTDRAIALFQFAVNTLSERDQLRLYQNLKNWIIQTHEDGEKKAAYVIPSGADVLQTNG